MRLDVYLQSTDVTKIRLLRVAATVVEAFNHVHVAPLMSRRFAEHCLMALVVQCGLVHSPI
jgi:hypothetical protein